MSPHEEKLLFAVMPHTLISLRKCGTASLIFIAILGKHMFVEILSHIQSHAFKNSPYTFVDGGFHFEANKGREVSPGIKQALSE